MTDSNIITIDEFKALAPEVDLSRYDNTTVSGLITSASKSVSDYLQYTPLAEDITDELKEASVSTEGDLIVFPAKIPIISVSSLKLKKGTTELSFTLTDSAGNLKYNIDYTKRHLRFPQSEVVLQGQTLVLTDFISLRDAQFYSIMSYRGGYEASALPQPIKIATSLYVREILSRSQNTTGAKSISQGGVSMTFFDRKDNKSDLVTDAETLLRSYRRIG